MYKQNPPFCVQIEPVEGCNLRCKFCGINGIRESSGDFKFMDLNTLSTILTALNTANWCPRIEFAMHGEPSMHPYLEDCIGLTRTMLPEASIQITSNGIGFVHKVSIQDLFDIGLNACVLDDYHHAKFVEKVLQRHDFAHQVFHYPAMSTYTPNMRFKKTDRVVIVCEDISTAKTGTHSKLNSHCGAAHQGKVPVHAVCAKPFRELSFRWDGNVAICCNDWRGEYKIGGLSAYNGDVVNLWNSSAFMAARKRLILARRDFIPCSKCDALSYRVGLLPDHRGLCTLPPITQEDADAMCTALDGASYTLPVRRTWE